MARKQVYKSLAQKENDLMALVESTAGGLVLDMAAKNDAADVLMAWDKDQRFQVWNALSKQGQRNLGWIACSCLGEDAWAEFQNHTQGRAMKIALRNQAEEVLAEELGKLEGREAAVRLAENELATLRRINGEQLAQIKSLVVQINEAENRARREAYRAEVAESMLAGEQLAHDELKAALALVGKHLCGVING